jgi:hypothetical protein
MRSDATANATVKAARSPWLRGGRQAFAVALVAAGLAGAAASPAAARVLLTQEQALALAFPGCQVQRTTAYLDAAQLDRAAALAGAPLPGALVHAYAGRCGDRAAGTAYFDTHKVRTLPETVMIVVDTEGRAARIEVLSFREPPDYLPRDGWYDQFTGRALDDELRLRRAVRPVTGATLTARATTEAVRRVLAIDRVLRESAAAAARRATATPAPRSGQPKADRPASSGQPR